MAVDSSEGHYSLLQPQFPTELQQRGLSSSEGSLDLTDTGAGSSQVKQVVARYVVDANGGTDLSRVLLVHVRVVNCRRSLDNRHQV